MAVETYHFADDGRIPNSALPLLVYRQVLTGGAFERRFAANDWRRAWRNGIYDFHHFHSTSHEVLGIAAGEALVRFGGAHGQTRVCGLRAHGGGCGARLWLILLGFLV